ncbi:hypothetical protein FH972_025839 [Carpinus fangiana]|uniref:C2H2-type domain-containing protein n=1 Tax=Carpinus fangiana TaxID=176857 RepID=A0A5N6L299_9ROSI|nr:hypothetical protein FH972_025839 [Carpinus fangiana]
MHQQTTQPPHMFNGDMRSASQQSTPGLQQDGFGQPMHSRNQSLDPSSAAFMGRSNGDWSGMQFTTPHRHTPSDQYSDVSSSAMPSPYLASDNFDPSQSSNSPLLNSQDPTLFPGGLGLERFSLNEPHQQQHISPGHSPHISPSVSPQPQHQMPLFSPSESLGYAGLDGQYGNGPGPDIDHSPDAFPIVGGQQQPRDSANFGGTMSPPEINIEPALEIPSINEPQAHSDHSGDALSPPVRSPTRVGRQRAISESYITPTSSQGTSPMRPRSPSLGLRPGASPQSISRSPSPSGGIQKPRRLSTPESRHWAIGLAERGQQATPDSSGAVSQNQSPYAANPNISTASTGTDSNRRVQKHPATFQCHLCPKRFTRAYNLRSHLRTHTDERPFVCTVCGKAFARQHDRKRHEGLHSGEKKFVCKGLLQSAINSGQTGQGQTWGCGRRFARADALGRHFRSEAGRACIKPLLEEEARERRAAMMEQANQDMMNNGGTMQMPPAQDIGLDSSTFTGMALPAALLQQYPALADIQWNAIPGPGQEDDYGGDASGRSSFDASSGGEFDYSFEDEGESGYVSGPGAMDGGSQYNSNRLNANYNGMGSTNNNGWSSDFGG